MDNKPEQRPRTAFISGPLEPGQDYFRTHYEARIREAIAAGDAFVMGPAEGMDTMARNFLLDEAAVAPERVTVYFSEQQVLWDPELAALKARVERLGGHVVVEGMSTGVRDAAMTRDSDYDILRYMSVEEQKAFYGKRYFPRVSNTEKNERRRLGLPLHVNHERDKVDQARLAADESGKDSRNGALATWKKGVSNMVNRVRST
ncbi:hypothetical protein HYPSUDRAFT_201071 [Hypholoma sublateritium FD-334 SS-4]|uniref:Uncharacterized protein n=1 Tax=Hypholoma sublateritium (strain FD-334 SS-4) TaxID=945553 RepID=A0A0D2P5H7_HYPSF|nr:hypothetical protein HYPSUDRAFT_201071 [Hypholoma sublateritium FD-334 SS-4]